MSSRCRISSGGTGGGVRSRLGVDLWNRSTVLTMSGSSWPNCAAGVIRRADITEAFPSSIGIVVDDEAGVRQANATITLYPVPWFQNRVDPNPRFVVYSNTQGEYVFSQNPFDPRTLGSPWLMSYPNYLVVARAGTLSGYGWMPITAASERITPERQRGRRAATT